MNESMLTTHQPVSAISRHILAAMLTGTIGLALFENGIDIDLLNGLIIDIVDGVNAGFRVIEEPLVHETIMELDKAEFGL